MTAPEDIKLAIHLKVGDVFLLEDKKHKASEVKHNKKKGVVYVNVGDPTSLSGKHKWFGFPEREVLDMVWNEDRMGE